MRQSMQGGGSGARWLPARILAAAFMAAAATLGDMSQSCGADTPSPLPWTDDAEAPLFRAEPADVAYMGPVDVAMFVFQPDELARRRPLAPVVAYADASIRQVLDDVEVGGAAPLELRLAAIDYVAVALRSEPVPAGDVSARGDEALEFEAIAMDLAIRFHDEVDLQAWLADFSGCKTLKQQGFTYFRLPHDESDNPGFVAQRDAHTIVVANRQERLLELVAAKEPAEVDAGFAEQWASVDGGLVTVAFPLGKLGAGRNAEFSTAAREMASAFLGIGFEEGKPNPFEVAGRTIAEGTKTACLGLDVDADLKSLVVRSTLGCPDYATAKQVRESVDLLQRFSKEYIRAVGGALVPQGLDPLMQMNLDAVFLGFRMFGDAELGFRLRAEDAVDVWCEARGEMPASVHEGLKMLAAQPAGKVGWVKAENGEEPR
jgi:hypothetical protein